MKWYKHDSNANQDAKLKRVRIKYGMEGYGLYWYCLELIAQNVETHNLTFELEHDAEIIAHDVGLHVDIVSDMMSDFVGWNLFECDASGVISCRKMATRTDDYTQKLLRKSDSVRTLSGQTPGKSALTEQNRTEQNRYTGRFAPPDIDEIRAYATGKGLAINAEEFFHFYDSKGWMVGRNKMKSWKSAVAGWAARDAKCKPDDSLSPEARAV